MEGFRSRAEASRALPSAALPLRTRGRPSPARPAYPPAVRSRRAFLREIAGSAHEALVLPTDSLPDDFDWRDHGAVGPVKNQISTSMEELHKELSEKKAKLRHVQDELNRRNKKRISDVSLQSLRSMVMSLQKNSDLKIEKGRLEADLISIKTTSQKNDDSSSDVNEISDMEKVEEEMASLKKALHDASHGRDKALQDLARLKKHLLDKLERALKVEMAKQEVSKKITNEEHQRSNEQIEDLKYKLANRMNALESKKCGIA